MLPVLIALALAIVVGIIFAAYNGLFDSLQAEFSKVGPIVMLYFNATGDYNKAGAYLTIVDTILERTAIVDKQSAKKIALFYDDPRETAAEKCRASFGIIYREGKGLEKPSEVAKLREALLANEHVKEEGLQVGFFPESKCVQVKCKFRDSMSMLIAIGKGYPVLRKHIKFLEKSEIRTLQKVKTSVEIYDKAAGVVTLALPYTPRTEMVPYPLAAPATQDQTPGQGGGHTGGGASSGSARGKKRR